MGCLAEAEQQDMILDDDPFPERPCLERRQRNCHSCCSWQLCKATEQAKRFSIAPVIRDGRDHCINPFSIVINAEEASCEGWEECVGPWRSAL